MQSGIRWEGIFPATTTPFTPRDTLDLAMFEKNLKAQLSAGVHGIIVGGTLGEASSLTPHEKRDLLHCAVQICQQRVPVVMNIAEQTTRAAIEHAQMAEKEGASGLMLLPPMRYRADDHEVLMYFRAVSKATSLPILIYNNPVDYKIEVTLNMFDAMQSWENIQAVKESTRDVGNVTRMINQFGDRYKILCGVDTLALESLFMGAHGWVAGLADAFPRETVSIYENVRAGRHAAALAIYRWFFPLLELDIHSKLVQYIKLAQVATDLGTEHVRPPRLPLSGKEKKQVWNIIQKAIRERASIEHLLV